jgi:N4-gp56 family major capsid protein
MADVYTDTTQWSAVVKTAYDRAVAYALRSIPQWRPLIDKHPVAQAMPGSTVTLTIHKDFAALATTPLTENTQPDSIAPPAPSTVNVVLNEYGATAKWSLRLEALSFQEPKPDMSIAYLLARHQADTIDALVRAIADGGTKIVWNNAGTATSTGTNGAIVAGNNYNRNFAAVAPTLLNRRNVAPKLNGDLFYTLAHPDVLYDLMAETGQAAWGAPHTLGGDTGAIYAGVVGDFMQQRYLRTNRCTITTDGGAGINVYNTYTFGREAIVEASAIEPSTVVGLQTDPMRRTFPLSWYGLLGWAIYRDEALQKVRTSSSIQALV